MWTSWTVKQVGDTWEEAGNVTFGSGPNGFRFTSFGLSGRVKSGPGNDGSQYGAITYNISGGFGEWEHADGVMVDMFEAGATATTFPISAWGFFWV